MEEQIDWNQIKWKNVHAKHINIAMRMLIGNIHIKSLRRLSKLEMIDIIKHSDMFSTNKHKLLSIYHYLKNGTKDNPEVLSTITKYLNSPRPINNIVPINYPPVTLDTTEPINIIDESNILLIEDKIKMIDPISKKLITNPVRGNLCKHIECFDHDTYLKFNESRKSSKKENLCPICKKCINQLQIIDNFLPMITALRELEDPTNYYVSILQDGTWKITT